MGFEIKDNVLVKYIEEPGVTDIVVPDGVKRIGENAFELCESLTSITIPDSVIEIRDEAFCCCSSLASVSIPNSVMKIGVAAFYNAPWLENQKDDYIIAGNNILIKYNGNDENVKIPNGVTMIGHEAFRKCFKLTSITIPHSVTEIGACAFYDCINLKTITIPDIYAPYVLNFLLLKKQLFRNRKTGAAIPHLNKELFFNLLIPIPPLAEQERIVAKIEELLPLVAEYDEAEQRLSALNTNFPEMLRKSILQQAVQGKLTERDPSDEPAAELLKRISEEKAKLIAEGKIKKEKPLPPITEDDCPFEIPDTWKWVRLGDIVRYQGGYAYKSDTYVKQSDNQVIRLGNVKNNALPLSVSPVYIPDHIAEETEDYRISEDTILFTMTGTKGKRDYFYTCRIKEENLSGCKLYLNQRVGCLSAYSNINLDWLTIVLQSEPILSQIFATATGNANQANIGSANTLKLMIPLPLLAEQQRIVARMEELLTACDMLK